MDVLMLKKEIDRLKQEDTSWNNIDRLAKLYVVHDHLADKGTPILAQSVVEVFPDCGDGEFCEAVSGKEILPLMALFAEHFEVIKTLYPKEYRAVIDQIYKSP